MPPESLRGMSSTTSEAGASASGREHRHAWDRLAAAAPTAPTAPWLPSVLARNSQAGYLRRFGSPRTLETFRNDVPVVSYDDLQPWIDRIRDGEADVLFAGRPIAFERTAGSTGAAKLIPYSAAGLHDFQRSLLPWLARTVRAHGITGRAYMSISPATRQPESVGGIPFGLPDGAYLGATAAALLEEVTAVPFAVAAIPDVARWRSETLRHLTAAIDLELVSVWSPTFLLQLLDRVEEPRVLWPDLKVVSCWANGASKRFAEVLAARLPQAHMQPKGLLSTETVVTVPDDEERPALTAHGFFEFEREGRVYLADDLVGGAVYEVVVTTASGLYRYRTGDLVYYEGLSGCGRPVLRFVGRGSLVSDLVGEKLTEPFVDECLAAVAGFRLLVPEPDGTGYVLLTEAGSAVDVEDIERRLCENPQYAYARRLGQLKVLRLLPIPRLFERYAQARVEQGIRLGDVKPTALRNESAWIARLGRRS
jgi:hypothetical protein